MSMVKIRTELLEQHKEIGQLVAQTRAAVEKAAHHELRACLARLTDAVHGHNAREVALLGNVLPTVDAWGPERAAIMLQEHQAEHEALSAMMSEARAAPDGSVAAKLTSTLLDELVDHMRREEKVLLGERVLRDDLFPADNFSG